MPLVRLTRTYEALVSIVAADADEAVTATPPAAARTAIAAKALRHHRRRPTAGTDGTVPDTGELPVVMSFSSGEGMGMALVPQGVVRSNRLTVTAPPSAWVA
ncbi:hypothetical protein Acy02nite_57050 [Actinoplanes cyaneus]|uniref:Uncharacterized protein n=1 Tax=Actinoplanes cyaneus TaxID=52696 RepID=A0A919ILC0_9ACTN|nr:hypothetical protein Acy02nite_57050 [Actinoplanes cyaneus]